MKDSTRKLVLTALFVALTFLVGMTPIGLIPLGFINVTVLCVPVVIGTLFLGLGRGLLLGFCFGLASMMSMMGLTMVPPSALAGALLAKNGVLAVIMCFAPRLLVPVATHFSYRLLERCKASPLAATPVAAICGSLTNTVFYLGLMLLFYTIVQLDSKAILGIIAGTGLIAGALEALTAALLTTPIVSALRKLEKN